MNKFDLARLKYKPKIIEYLLVAETPPKLNSNRYFYFENVYKQDSLFLETMKFLYPNDTQNFNTKIIRSMKNTFLGKFKQDGFYLIDSLEKPFERKYSTTQKVRLLINGQNQLLSRIKELLSKNTKVILIAAPVYKANYKFLTENGIPVINKELINFPGSGGQKKYRQKMKSIITISTSL
ncbi:MAG: hypothetical protein CMG69_06230 [Candidatus Marinimicrobia bacterium]|nr:hypothetical protein [Candidatus Neomarinimicrobiota bacterium]|tara:strand:+ start:449 stop:988 length:540 start_codon:yes stop_codon:yes gene_type:complete